MASIDHKENELCVIQTVLKMNFYLILIFPFYAYIRSKYIKQYYKLRPSVFTLEKNYVTLETI